jgi:hypothetical protein
MHPIHIKKRIDLWREETAEVDGSISTSVKLEGSGLPKSHLWYRVPAEYGSRLTSSLDPFVVATIFMAMLRGTDLRVHGEVSPSLLRNLEAFQLIWTRWRPTSYTKIEIIADAEREQPRAEESAGDIVAFSGGIDSSFTAFSHTSGGRGRLNRTIKSGMLMQKELFKPPYQDLKAMLSSLGIELIPVATNADDFKPNNIPGNPLPLDHFVPITISCLMLFQGTYRAGLFASSEPYQALVTPWSTHPLTDPLLSSDSFSVIHDGAEFTRTEKTTYLVDWPEALSSLQVCWQEEGANCGKCRKCIRTILNFRVAGIGLPQCFKQDVSNDEILNLKVNSVSLSELELILSAAEEAVISDSWVKALRTCIEYNKFRVGVLSPMKQVVQKFVKGNLLAVNSSGRDLTLT